jgi:fatty-acyl-CoA synthase
VAVVVEGDAPPSADQLVEFLTGRVSRWWLPERWAFIAEVPKTSVGKFDKKRLRSQYADGALEVVEVEIQTGR